MILRLKVLFFSTMAFSFLGLFSGSPINGQTFVDRRDPNAFRVVSYNVHQDDLFETSAAEAELLRMIIALDADVYNFQECYDTSATEIRNLFNTIAPIGGSGWQTHKGRNQLIVSKVGLSMRETNVPNGTRGIAMAMVDLPDTLFGNDLYILNNHFPCCDNDPSRIEEAQAIADWIQDAITAGGNFDFAPGTAISILGDLNTVGGPDPLDILLNGDGLSPDWDGSSITAPQLLHNARGSDIWTWRNDQSQFGPGLLDYIIHTDSVIRAQYGFVFNPQEMTNGELNSTGLQATDYMLNKDQPSQNVFDHLPLVVDYVTTDPTIFAPETVEIINGVYGFGDVTNLEDSDNIDYTARRSNTDVQSRVVLEVKGTSSATYPSEIQFSIEGSVFARTDVTQTIEFWNYQTSQFETVDSRDASRFVDSVTMIEPTGDVLRFVEAGTGCVRARLRFQSGTARQKFAANIDAIGWTFN